MTLEIEEEQRQMLLMALAHLAVERPGWDMALSEIAAKIDNSGPDGPQMYTEFKRFQNSNPTRMMISRDSIHGPK